ncbi:MAG TPA: hypothetical protein VFX28_00875 [Methylomirabilota bacterium]|nr:hypothetical protein [Methylomirabilota bacterium]
MAATVAASLRTRRWTRVEYERLVELDVFQPGERLELLDGLLVVREPQGSRHAAGIRRALAALRRARSAATPRRRRPLHGRRYRSVATRRPPAAVRPLVVPGRPIPVADFLP